MIINFIIILSLYSLASLMMHFKKCKHILLANACTNLLGATYLFINDAQVGFLLCLIGAASSLFQYVMPENCKCPREKTIRNTVALSCAFIAVILFYSGPADILICSSIMLTRWAEASLSSQKVRVATAFSSLAWALYSAENALHLMLVAEIVLLISALWAIYRIVKAKPLMAPAKI